MTRAASGRVGQVSLIQRLLFQVTALIRGIDLQTGEATRPYRFGEFDILAVNMHPSTRDWNRFLFTVSKWLLLRSENATLIEIFQPVAQQANAFWTDNLQTCLQWFATGDQKRILEISPDLLRRRTRVPK